MYVVSVRYVSPSFASNGQECFTCHFTRSTDTNGSCLVQVAQSSHAAKKADENKSAASATGFESEFDKGFDEYSSGGELIARETSARLTIF